MKFSEEDGILTAAQARARTTYGVEDSIVREELREIMAKIKIQSGYGYPLCFISFQSRHINPAVREQLEKIGYKVESEPHEHKGINGRTEYQWEIDWSLT